MELNPHPDGQLNYNIPKINGEKLLGTQHKYHETALFSQVRDKAVMLIVLFASDGLNLLG